VNAAGEAAQCDLCCRSRFGAFRAQRRALVGQRVLGQPAQLLPQVVGCGDDEGLHRIECLDAGFDRRLAGDTEHAQALDVTHSRLGADLQLQAVQPLRGE